MKLTKPKTARKQGTDTIVITDADLSETVQTYMDIFDELDNTLVGRTDELNGLKYALLTRSHLMLEGPQGTAKSALASNVFRRFKGVEMFHHQFTGASDRDQIFGPMRSEVYRKEAIYEHNIDGHLPTAHFFFADEVYRSSPAILSTLFGILNEREFNNGRGILQCPLISAVGTTNFETEDDVLTAFHDRWTVKALVKPLTSPAHLLDMFRCIIKAQGKTETTMPLEDLETLQEAASRVTIAEDILSVFAEICAESAKIAVNHKVAVPSNRRMVTALKFIQASALLDNRPTATFHDIDAAKMVLFPIGHTNIENEWAGIFGKYAQEIELIGKDKAVLEKFSRAVEKFRARYDEDMSKADAKKEYMNITDLLSSAKALPEEHLPKSVSGRTTWARVVQGLEELLDAFRAIALPQTAQLDGYERDEDGSPF